MQSLQQLLDYPQLRQAWEKVRQNGGGPGSDGVTLKQFTNHLQANLWSLVTEVRATSYQPRPLLAVMLRKPGKKPRKLAIPAVRDRVLQTLVAQHLTPLLEEEFENVSYGYRRGRSVDNAIRHVMRLRDQGYTWVVDADIRAYFDNINHQMLLLEASRFIPDRNILKLIQIWLRTPIQEAEGEQWCPTRGVPQGSPLSPLLANLYLDWFDEQLLQQHHRLVRFADDFLILCKNRDQAEQGLALTSELLQAMGLQLSREKTRVTHFDQGFRFLGTRFLRSLVMRSSVPDIQETRDADDLAQASARQHQGGEQLLAPPPSTRPPLLRTLYITGYGAQLSQEGESILLRPAGAPLQRIPMRRIDQIMIFGNLQLTLPFIKACLRQQLPISLFSAGGKLYGVIDDRMGGNIELQSAQFKLGEDEAACLQIASVLVQAKIHNTLTILRRYARHHSLPAFDQAINSLRKCRVRARKAARMETLLGEEGAAARLWFQAWRHCFETSWGFEGRRRRPPPDPINALLSFGYTLLYQNTQSLIRSAGLHPGMGFLHKPRAGHAALASDLLEMFRAPVIDALVLDLALNQQLQPDDFASNMEKGSCRLRPEARNRFIHAFENKMNSSFSHPVTGRMTDYRRCIQQQVHALVQWLAQPDQPYPPLMLR